MRAGAEDSKTTEKPMRAADDAARLIVSQFAPGATESARLFHKPGKVLQDNQLCRSHRSRLFPVAGDRTQALPFAKDIAGGLLEELARALADRLAVSAAGAAAIENATANARGLLGKNL